MKAKSAIKLVCLILLAVFFCVWASFGIKGIWIYNLKPLHKEFRKGADIKGGIIASYSVAPSPLFTNDESLSKKIENTIYSLRYRLYYSQVNDAFVERNGNNIHIEVSDPNRTYSSADIYNKITRQGVIRVVTSQGAELFSCTGFKSVDQPSETEGSILTVHLNDVEKDYFATATREISEAQEDDESRKLSIYLDDDLIGYYHHTGKEEVANGKLPITFINSADISGTYYLLTVGALQLELTQTSFEMIPVSQAYSTMVSYATYSAIGFAVALLIMIIIYRMSGLMAGISLAYYGIVAAFFFATYPSIRLTISGIWGLIVVGLMSIITNIIILTSANSEYSDGKSIELSFNNAYSNNKRLFRLIYGVLIGAGVALAFVGFEPVKNFGLVLALGMFLNIFTTIFLTKKSIKWVYSFFNKDSIIGLKKGGNV